MRTLLASLLAALVLAPAALADDLPWAGGAAVETQTEVVLGQAAAAIAARPVHVRCEGDTDWTTLTRDMGTGVVGFVWFTNGQAVDYMELSPGTCAALDAFVHQPPADVCGAAVAAPAPAPAPVAAPAPAATTEPAPGATVTRKPAKATVKAAVKAAAKKRKRVRARHSTRVALARTAGPCSVDSQALYALWTLTHEATHLAGQQDEPTADCYGLQWLQPTAATLGAGPAAAQAYAAYAASWYASAWQTGKPGYWSPECRPGGALDLHPDDPAWP